jgi:hypothetical protein
MIFYTSKQAGELNSAKRKLFKTRDNPSPIHSIDPKEFQKEGSGRE